MACNCNYLLLFAGYWLWKLINTFHYRDYVTITWTVNFQMLKLDLLRGRGTRDQIANICWIIKKAREFQKNIYFCFIDHAKAFHCVDHNKLCGKFLKRWDYQTIWTASWEICMQVKKQQLELDMRKQTSSKWGKEYVKAVYCHPAYLTFMQSTSCKMLGWKKHKLESRLLGEISVTSDTQMTPHFWQKGSKNLEATWWKWKRRVKKLT